MNPSLTYMSETSSGVPAGLGHFLQIHKSICMYLKFKYVFILTLHDEFQNKTISQVSILHKWIFQTNKYSLNKDFSVTCVVLCILTNFLKSLFLGA